MDRNRHVPMVKKIVTIENRKDMALFKRTVTEAGGRIVKELPIVDGYLCEFPEDVVITAAVRGMEEKIKIEDDITFKLCCLAGFPFPYSYFPKPQAPQPQPAPEQGPPAISPGRMLDWGLKRIKAPEAWEMLNDRRVRVGIIDTGIDSNHSDLVDNIKEGICTLDDRTSFIDDYGHGTHIAGTIAANNKNGQVGINPYVDLYIVKAFNKNGSGSLSDIIEGIDWLMRRQVDIINMSFSTSESSSLFERAISSAYGRGIILVAAAGNDGGTNSVHYPARFPQVIAVSAIDRDDNIARFSSTGPEVDFCAPGVDITSTWLRGGYDTNSGTSFAAPHITGTVADLLNYHGNVPPRYIKGLMASKAIFLTNLTKEEQGAGMLEIPSLLQ